MKGGRLLRFAFIWLLLVHAFTLSAQNTSADSLKIHLKNKSYNTARKQIIKTLSKKPDQSDIYFKTTLAIYDSSIIAEPSLRNVLIDSLFKITDIWHTVNSSCDVLNEESKRHFLYRKPDKAYKENVCPYLRNSFSHCEKFEFYPESILALKECINTYSFTVGRQDTDCKLENQIWEFIANHPGLSHNIQWQNLKNKVKCALLACPLLSCENLDSLFLKETKSEDINESKKVSSLLSQKNCTNSQLYKWATKRILNEEPSFNGLYQFAIQNKKEGKISEAYSYLVKAEKHTANNHEKTLVMLGFAELLEIQTNYGKAKEFAQLASVTDPENKESFVFLANLYKKAESICKLTNQAHQAALFALISENYKKAGLNLESERYKKQSENISSFVKEKRVRLECFINEEIEIK